MVNLHQDEVEKFSALGSRWWDLNGPCQPLHALNVVRTEYIERFCLLPHQHVLDVGCGAGILTEALSCRGAQVTGIDASAELIQVAALHAQKSQLNITYETKLVHEVTDSFSLVTCMELLEHVPDPGRLVQECAQVTKPGGYLVFSTLNRTLSAYCGAILAAEYILKILPPRTHDYASFIKPAELHQWARQAGLVIQDIQGVAFSPLTRQARFSKNLAINYLLLCHKQG